MKGANGSDGMKGERGDAGASGGLAMVCYAMKSFGCVIYKSFHCWLATANNRIFVF